MGSFLHPFFTWGYFSSFSSGHVQMIDCGLSGTGAFLSFFLKNCQDESFFACCHEIPRCFSGFIKIPLKTNMIHNKTLAVPMGMLDWNFVTR
jgi:hypothetical protein